jgi:hypothetical protein
MDDWWQPPHGHPSPAAERHAGEQWKARLGRLLVLLVAGAFVVWVLRAQFA